MIAVSSHRPHTDEEYRKNQTSAFRTWVHIFDRIIYLGHPEKELSCPKTVFIPSEQPRIYDLVSEAANHQGLVTILNADIILSKQMNGALSLLSRNGSKGATSRRYNFTPPNIETGQLTDFGLDVFVAPASSWKLVKERVPKDFWIGHRSWDTWMVSYMNKTFKSKMFDFTNFRCVFHPIHTGRNCPHEGQVNTKDKLLHSASLPATKLR